MKRLSGFSLMEMMTVLLIVSIVAAATAPMINKKMMTSANNDCPWVNVNNGIAYNTNNGNRTVNIGTDTRNNLNPRLNIRTDNDAPQITLEDNQENIARLFFRNGSFGFTNSNEALGTNAIAIGRGNASSTNSIAIGSSNTSGENSIAIGNNNRSTNNSIVIGNGGTIDEVSMQLPDTISDFTIIGNNASATGRDSIVIGNEAASHYWTQVVIGKGAEAYCAGSIAIGGESGFGKTIAGRPDRSGMDCGIAIGSSAQATGMDCIAIGHKTKSSGTDAIAIGSGTTKAGSGGIAIGADTQASGIDSTAIGTGAITSAKNSTAIGAGAIANKKNQIVLGTADSTVYIPGRLVVAGNTLLGENETSVTFIREGSNGDHDPRALHLLQRSYGDIDRAGSGKIRAMDMKPLVGTLLWQEDWAIESDRRLKNVGKAFVGGLEELKKLDLFHYTYKKDKSNTPHVGVMAQDLQKVFPDAVTKGDDGFLRIRMEDMFYALINAVKELAGLFDKQDEKIVQLEKENKQLQKTVADLEKQNKDILKRLEKLEKQK